MKVKSFVDEGEAISFVSDKLQISYSEAEILYSDIGGYQGSAVSFNLHWPNEDSFSKVIQEFMEEKGLQNLQLHFDD